MSSIVDMLSSQLGAGGIEAISRQLGIDPQTAQQAVAGAIPILTGALARNAASPDGAAALDQALQQHDGSILDQALTHLSQGNTADGDGILGHILGGHRSTAENGLAQATGLNAGTAGQLLMMLAPLVMGAVGRARNRQQLDPGDLAGMLRAEHEQAQSAAPSGVLGALAGLLDTNHDGSVVDDVTRIGGGLLGSLFGGKQ
jgi:hypothetical protein